MVRAIRLSRDRQFSFGMPQLLSPPTSGRSRFRPHITVLASSTQAPTPHSAHLVGITGFVIADRDRGSCDGLGILPNLEDEAR